MTRIPRPAVEATGLVKVFGDTRALNGVDLLAGHGPAYSGCSGRTGGWQDDRGPHPRHAAQAGRRTGQGLRVRRAAARLIRSRPAHRP